MSTPEQAPSCESPGSKAPRGAPTAPSEHDPAIVAALIKDIDTRLRSRHLARPVRLAITEGLRPDLVAAQADGRDPRQLLGADLDDFVRQVVVEGDYPTTTHNPLRLSVKGTLLAIPAIVVTYVLFFEVVLPLLSTFLGPHLNQPRTGVAGAWVGVGAVGALAVMAVLTVVLHGKPEARRTLEAAVLTVAAAATAAVLGNVLILHAASRVSTGSIAAQVLVVLVPLAGALALARWWGLRRAGS